MTRSPLPLFSLALLVCALASPVSARAAATPMPSGVTYVNLASASAGAVSAASATHASYPASKAFDGNRVDTNGRWLSTKADHMYVVYHFLTATKVNAIRVWNGADNAGGWNSTGRAPKAWTFSGSNDGVTWDPLDTQTAETGWAENGEARYYEFSNNTAYEYYKYDCTELNGGTDYLQLWELEFYDTSLVMTKVDRLNRVLAPLGYVVAHTVALDGTPSWGPWLRTTSVGYPDYAAAAAQPHARLAILCTATENVWWNQFWGYYDGDNANGQDLSKLWLQEEAGSFKAGNPAFYELESGKLHTGKYFELGTELVLICDLPDFTGHSRIDCAYWNFKDLSMHVIVPNGRILPQTVFSPNPTTLALGESVPVTCTAVNKTTGEPLEGVVPTVSGDVRLSYQNGILRAKATGNGALTAIIHVNNEVITNKLSVTIPVPDTSRYECTGSWEIGAVTGSNWWTPVSTASYPGLSRALRHPGCVMKIESSNSLEKSTGSSVKYYINNTVYEIIGWANDWPAGATKVAWLGLADPVNPLNQIVSNNAPGIRFDRISVYEKPEYSVIRIR